jgi:2'-5' RNA ligase
MTKLRIRDMKHRIFIALPVSFEAKRKILQWQKCHKNIPVRWIKSRNLHITLISPWYTKDIEAVHKKLKAITHGPPLSLRFFQITVGPNNHSLRLIWIEGKRNKQHVILKRQLESILDLQPEKRAFLPHITIGRLRKGEKISFEKIPEKISWRLEIKSFCLMESHLLRAGAEYRMLRTYNLL